MSALQRDVSYPVFHDTFTILDQHYSPMWDHYFQIQGCIQLARHIIKRVLLLAACGTLVGSALLPVCMSFHLWERINVPVAVESVDV